MCIRDSYDAAKKLAYDFGIDPDKPPAAAALRKPKYPLAKAFQKEELHCQRILYDYLHLLERWKMQYAPKTPEDTLDDRVVEALSLIHIYKTRTLSDVENDYLNSIKMLEQKTDGKK